MSFKFPFFEISDLIRLLENVQETSDIKLQNNGQLQPDYNSITSLFYVEISK